MFLLFFFFFYSSLVRHFQFGEKAKVKCSFVTGARTQILVAETASTVWANTLHKYRDAVQGKVKNNVSFESFAELCSALEREGGEV